MAYKSVLKKILAVALALLVWQLGAMALDSSLLLVSPVETARELFVQVRDPAFWGTVGFSLQRILLGFGAAFLTASVMAGLSFRFPVVETLLWPYITVAKSTPVASIIILCLIWLSSRSLSVFISFLMALPVLYANILQGLKVYDPWAKRDYVENQYHDLEQFMADVDMVVVMVAHSELREDLSILKGKVVLDTRNVCPKNETAYKVYKL